LKRLRSILACAASTAIVAAGATSAIADDIYNGLDSSIDATAETLALAPSSTGTTTLYIDPTNGDGKNGCNLTGSTTFTASVSSNNTSVATVSPSTVTFTACGDTKVLTVTAVGAGTATISLTGGTNTSGGTFNLAPATFVVNVSAPVPTNTAPSAPGAPMASANPTQGGFTLEWAPSTDAESNAFTYTLEGRDSDDTSWSPVASGLTDPSYTFGTGSPTEGTWTYRVKAVETGTSPMSSDWSANSALVVVDRSAPNAPFASPSSSSPYADSSGTSWWKDSVTVTFTENGDPALADGSAGSGVDSVSGSETVSKEGPFELQGTVKDKAGNVSAATPFSGAIDSTAPVVMPSCPSGDVILGSSAQVSWTASDAGSGLASAPSGTLSLDTSTVGPQSVTVPGGTAIDHVGNVSEAVTCNYKVVYNFDGFFRPVDMAPATNVAKAGSAIPVKFSLHGNYGLGIIASGYPKFVVTGTATSGDSIEEYAAATNSGLTYDASADQYVYVWKTDKTLAGKSGTFTLKLNDGTTHTATFSFTK
jgi:hypothetical protein